MIPAEYGDEITECAHRHGQDLYRFLVRLTQGDHALAQDLVQQVLMQAAEKWSELGVMDRDGQRNRLYQLAIWRAIDVFRKNSTAREYQPVVLARFQPPETDLDAHVITKEAIERFIKVIEAMPTRQAI